MNNYEMAMPRTTGLWSTIVPEIFDNLYGRELTIEAEGKNDLVKWLCHCRQTVSR
jgi:hypothetical protein